MSIPTLILKAGLPFLFKVLEKIFFEEKTNKSKKDGRAKKVRVKMMVEDLMQESGVKVVNVGWFVDDIIALLNRHKFFIKS